MKVFCSCSLRGVTSHPCHPSPWTCHWTPQDFCAGLLTSDLRASEIKTNKFFYSDDISIVLHPLHKGREMRFFKNSCNGLDRSPCKIPMSTPISSNFVHPPLLSLPCYLQLPPCSFCFSVVLFLWLNGWSNHIWCAISLNDDMDLHMLSHGTLVPEGDWCMFYATRHKVYWGLAHDKVFYLYSDLISHTCKHTHTAHSGCSRLAHPYE